jgi:lysozyme
MHILSDDMGECVVDLSQLLRNFEQFAEARKAALISMRFNLGPMGFRLFRKMIAAINYDDWQGAHDAALDSLWAKKQVGARAHEIAQMLLTGRW